MVAPILVQIYDRLPPTLSHVAASARGLYLNWWRYGPQAEEWVDEALERNRWSQAHWKTYQENRLSQILHRAVTRVPYYRDLWQSRRHKGDTASWEYPENWPILSKEQVRAQPLAFVADDCNPRRMYHLYTSGTTGKPLPVWRSRETETHIFALIEARARRWHGVTRFQNWAILGGQKVVSARREKPPFWVHNWPGHQLYLSANHISRQNAPAYADILRRCGVTHLIAYASSAAFLSQQLLDRGLELRGQMECVVTSSEPLHPWQRDVIARGMKTDVYQMYGMGETVVQASEDPQARLRLWPEVGMVEILADDGDVPTAAGTSGRMIGTGLLNPDMIFIRYDTGDRGALSPENPAADDPCQLPYLRTVEGRQNDMLIAPDGRRVYWLNPIFYGLPVIEAQIIQESLETVRVLYVPAADFTPQAGSLIQERMRERMGDVQVMLEFTTRIPRGANGKFQAVICRVAPPAPP